MKHQDVEGIKWGEGTVANIRFTGVPLRDVLQSAMLNVNANDPEEVRKWHVCFASHAAECQEDSWFGASIPLQKVLDEDGGVMIALGVRHPAFSVLASLSLLIEALQMNGHPLTPIHGFPFRMVVPGYSGVRWVKWLDHITVSPLESSNFYQRKDYKVLPPEVNLPVYHYR